MNNSNKNQNSFFINKDKEEGVKVETKISSVKNTIDYHIPNEDKIPYHEK